MKPEKVAHIMALVDECIAGARVGDALKHRTEVEAALRAHQAEPTDAKDASRYRYLVVMETKAAPDTVAHYIRNPEHLDRVIEVMEQKP